MADSRAVRPLVAPHADTARVRVPMALMREDTRTQRCVCGRATCADQPEKVGVMKLLRGARVIELDGPFGSSCARFLGSLGAEVVKVVAPAAARAEDPVAAYEDADKQRLVLDLARPDDA